MATTTVVDTTEIAVAGADVQFDNTIQQDGSALNLAGKTVTATIRRADDFGTVLHANLEDVSVTVDDEAGGGVLLTHAAAVSALFASHADPTLTLLHLLEYTVVEDDYKPQMLRFPVRRALN